MTDSMIERVARAINETANKQFNAYVVDKEVSFALARAAIAAMREPTEAMIEAGKVVEIEPPEWLKAAGRGMTYKSFMASAPTAQHWRAMIDAALKEP